MAKVSFNKLGIKYSKPVKIFNWEVNEDEYVQFEMISYLPMAQKLELIADIINQSIDENGYYNPLRIKIFTALEVISTYTNIAFTDKQKEDPCKLYDLVYTSGLFDMVINWLDDEYTELVDIIEKVIHSIYEYKNSAMGILDMVKNDYSDLNLDATEIEQKLANGENIELVKEILSKLG